MSERAAALAKLKAARANKDASKAPIPADKLLTKSTSTLLAGAPLPSSSSSRPQPKILVPSSSSPAKASFHRPNPTSNSSTSKFFRKGDDGDPTPRFGAQPRAPLPSASTSSSSFTAYRPSVASDSRSSSVTIGDEPPRKRPDNSRSNSPAPFSRPQSSASGLSVTRLGLDASGTVQDLDSDSDTSSDPIALEDLFDDEKIKLAASRPRPPKVKPPVDDNSDVEILAVTSKPAVASTSSSSSSSRIANNPESITRFANKWGLFSRSHVERVLQGCSFRAADAERELQQQEDKKMGKRSAVSKPLVVAPVALPPKEKRPVEPSATQQRRGEQSAIYANRKSLGGGGGTPVSDKKQKKREEKEKKRSKGSDAGSDEEGSGGNDGEYGSGGKRGMARWERDEEKEEAEALVWFSTCDHQALLDVTTCTDAQATIVLSTRPYEDVDDLRSKFNKKRGISQKIFDDYIEIMQGYHKVDAVLKGCEDVGDELSRAMSVFTSADAKKGKGKAKEEAGVKEEPVVDQREDETAVDLVAVELKDVEGLLREESDPERKKALRGYIKKQPETLAEGVVLKDYQLLGVNWINLLYSKGLSCILADEMGLGKTIQVISFLAHLHEKETPGRHLIIVPSSTLENWAREFQRFCPEIDVQTYYGTQAERAELGYQLLSDQDVEVVLTTYTIAAGTNKDDKKFFKRMKFHTAIFDEGHQLKNYQSARYKSLMDLKVSFRLLLTGTPLQNNLQELVSVLNFILPDYFEDAEDALRAIFKVGGSSHANLLSKQRVSRAQKMMKPFVLRRRKDQVLKELPPKTVRIEWCPLTPSQDELYKQQESHSAKILRSLALEADKNKKRDKSKKRGRDDLEINNGPQVAKKVGDSGSNVLMNLRKAASHPLLFRTHYSDTVLKVLAKDIMKEPEYMASDYQLIIEDMEIMSDSELHGLCKAFKSTRKHALPPSAFLDCGKVEALRKIIDDCLESGKRLLLFSMFTQILDILKTILDHLKIKWVILTGTTKVDERQSLVDEFTNDDSIKVFLLSTLAGGMGINLTAASVVVVYDQGFNPHNEKQAADRAHRLGQTQPVEIITLLSRGTVDEDINDLALSKLRLDDAVAGRAGPSDGGAGEDEKESESKAKASLLTKLRGKLELKEAGVGSGGGGDVVMSEEAVKSEAEAGVGAAKIEGVMGVKEE